MCRCTVKNLLTHSLSLHFRAIRPKLVASNSNSLACNHCDLFILALCYYMVFTVEDNVAAKEDLNFTLPTFWLHNSPHLNPVNYYVRSAKQEKAY